MMRWMALFLVLAACGRVPGEPALIPTYRDPAVPIASKALFEPGRYLGLWYEIARYPVPFEAGCRGVTAEYGALEEGLLSVVSTCRNGSGAITGRIEGTARVVGPGRLEVRFPSVPFVAADYWVLWVDEGYRTAVVGVPSGRAGWILNREPRIPPDRLAAAREILDFNGYDLSELALVPQP